MKQYTLKVYPKGNGRNTYRVIQICGTESLDRLCKEIIDSFEFIDEHLYEFCMDNRMYSEDSYQSEPEYSGQPTTKEKIDALHLEKGQKFTLHYDFGDDWLFVISVQKIQDIKEKVKPCVIKEKGFVEQYGGWDEYEWE